MALTTFPLIPDRIKKITPEFKTTIVKFENGVEQRLANWNNDKKTLQIAFQYLSKDNLDTLWDFFKARKGAFEKFYFVNHLENTTDIVRFKDDTFPTEFLNVSFAENLKMELIKC